MLLQLFALRVREIFSVLQRIQRTILDCVHGQDIAPMDIVSESSSSESVNELV